MYPIFVEQACNRHDCGTAVSVRQAGQAPYVRPRIDWDAANLVDDRKADTSVTQRR